MIPPERLLVLSLEKGFGWEEICEFLGHEVPDTPYPRVWALTEFQQAVKWSTARDIRKSRIILAGAVVAVGTLAFVGWCLRVRR